jgi:alpha-glucosidase (family GH31 glycosyl hydrolase)
VRLTICKPEIVRVEFDPTGNFVINKYSPGDEYNPSKRDLATYLMRDNWPAVSFTPADKGTYVSFATSRLTVRVYKSPLRIQFWSADNTKLINKDDDATGMECNTGGSAPCDLFIKKTKSATEHFFGFGNGNRMAVRPIDYAGQDEGQNPSGSPYPAGGDGEHYSSPFFFSTDGYGLFVILDRPFNSGWQMPYRNDKDQTYWDMGKSNAGQYSVHWWRTAGNNEYRQYLIYYFMYGPSWKEVIARYDDIAGKPPIMPKWSYGVHMNCFAEKFGASPSAKTYEDAITGYRSGNYPMDVLYLDCDLLTDGRNWGTLNNSVNRGYTWFFDPGTSYWTGAQTKSDTGFLSWAATRGVHIGANLHQELCALKDAPVVKTWVDRGFDV